MKRTYYREFMSNQRIQTGPTKENISIPRAR